MALTWFEEPASSFWCRLSQYLFPFLPLCNNQYLEMGLLYSNVAPTYPKSWIMLPIFKMEMVSDMSEYLTCLLNCSRISALSTGQNGYWTSQKHSFQCVRYLHHCLPTHLEHWIVAAVKRCHVSHFSRVWRWDPTRQGRPFRSTFCLDEGHSIDGVAKTICTFPSPS